jgi:hypothetical protein
MGMETGASLEVEYITNQNGDTLVWSSIYSATIPGDFYALGEDGEERLPVPVFLPVETSPGVFTATVKKYGDSMTVFGEPFTGSHTYKNYWFGFDGKHFFEYGGVEIDEEDIKKLAGGAEILDEIKTEGEITAIYYRECGIININYSGHEDGVAEGYNFNRYNTYTLETDGETESLIFLEGGGGIYLQSVTAEYGEDLAVGHYPAGAAW